MMDIILRPHQAYAATYLDDVVVHFRGMGGPYGPSAEGALVTPAGWASRQPPQVPSRILRSKVPGFPSWLRPHPPRRKKVEAVLTAPRPQTKTQIKTALASSPVLRALDFSCPFLLQMDASDTGLGAVLSQIQEGEENLVIYISRKLSPAKRNYATVEKEALAIKWAVLELRYCLLGRKFTLVTDHAPLQWMARAKDTNARVTRWFLALQDFHFEVQHRAGAANADGLSRNANGLSWVWTAYAGLSRVIPHPPLISPLLTPFEFRIPHHAQISGPL
ncbi:hypothetical protein M9458_029269 [Cirrhinus mrigala]|uniref:Reverse transcriptase RNase H-like domain-containing protein n=1 Tax=Cirrhinus mrigala TaxID=683832 RepID=A0ABD0PSC4_CIRMR